MRTEKFRSEAVSLEKELRECGQEYGIVLVRNVSICKYTCSLWFNYRLLARLQHRSAVVFSVVLCCCRLGH